MSLFCRLFHRKRTSPRRDEDGCYMRCTECGTRLPWGWKDRTPVGHHLTAPADKAVRELERIVGK